MEPFAAVILAGGAGRRMGGVDKPTLVVGGRPMRDRVLDAVAGATSRVLVGPAVDLPPGVLAAREDPPGGGPVAATAAGLALLDPTRVDAGPPTPADAAPRVPALSNPGSRVPALADPAPRVPALSNPWPRVPALAEAGGGGPAPRVVALLAADLPLLTRAAVDELRRALADSVADGACYLDDTGRRQNLCGLWRTEALRSALCRLRAARPQGLAGASLRTLLTGLDVVEIPWTGAGPPPWFDCDTVEDVRWAEEWVW